MNRNWVIIADDFTGAGDSAVQFGSPGKPVRLLMHSRAAKDAGGAPAAIVVDTDTRFLGADEAYGRVSAAARELYASGARSFFKKVDSTLRGNPGAEIAAVMDAARYRFAVVAPAAPRNKRTVVGGVCLVAGQPITATALARDPLNPMTESRVSKLMERRFPGAVRELSLETVRSDGGKLREAIEGGLAHGARLFVADAETMDDLKAIASLSSMEGLLFAGSSGLAEALASGASSEKEALPRIERGRALYVIGSVTPTSAVQCEQLVRVGASEIVVDVRTLLKDAAGEKSRLAALIGKAPAEQPLLLRTSGSTSPEAADFADKNAGVVISRFLGDLTLDVARFRDIRFLFASGGDTAAKIVSALGVDSIDFTTEILPGLPFGFFRSKTLGRELYFVSKSGGFGDPDAMAKSLAMVAPAPAAARSR